MMECFRSASIQYPVSLSYSSKPSLNPIAEKIVMQQGTATASLMMGGLDLKVRALDILF